MWRSGLGVSIENISLLLLLVFTVINTIGYDKHNSLVPNYESIWTSVLPILALLVYVSSIATSLDQTNIQTLEEKSKTQSKTLVDNRVEIESISVEKQSIAQVLDQMLPA